MQKEKVEEKAAKERDIQAKIFKMNSEMHTTQKDIEQMAKELQDIDLEITEKIKVNQDKTIESAKIEMSIQNLYRKALNFQKKVSPSLRRITSKRRKTKKKTQPFILKNS